MVAVLCAAALHVASNAISPFGTFDEHFEDNMRKTNRSAPRVIGSGEDEPASAPGGSGEASGTFLSPVLRLCSDTPSKQYQNAD